MAADGFLKLDGVKGESKDKTHHGEIHILDVHWNLNQQGSMGTQGGGGTGKVDFHDISFTKRFDLSSPVLMGFCANGKHIKNGLVTIRKAGEHPLEFLKIKLEDIIVSGSTPSGLGSGDGMEHLTLNFAKFHMTYVEQKEDGTKGDTIEFGWDVKANTKM
jgi:type VI secretion system secreted protein Hcp